MLAVNLTLIVACPLVFLGIHAVLSRVWPQQAHQRIALASILVATVACLALLWPMAGRDVVASIYALTVVLAMGYIYFHFFNMGETARRIRIVIELWKKGRVTESELIETFQREDPVQVRLDRLVSLGQLRKENDLYFLSGRVLWWAAAGVAGWRNLLGYTDEPEA